MTTPIPPSETGTSAIPVSTVGVQAIRETLYLLSVPGMREVIENGMAEPLEESAKELDW